MTEGDYRVRVEDHANIRLLTLDRPEKLNSFTATGYHVLADRLEEIATAAPETAVVVITGAGRAFCAGADLTELARPGGAAELGSGFDRLIRCLLNFPLPLLAAVNGLAVGFGASLLLHCDIVIVDVDASVQMPFVALGTCAEAGSSWLLPQRVGFQPASWMILSGETLNAEAAVAAGFALGIAAPGTSAAEAIARGRRLASHPLAALTANKRLLRHGHTDAVLDAWQRERDTMAELAEKIGPVGRGTDR